MLHFLNEQLQSRGQRSNFPQTQKIQAGHFTSDLILLFSWSGSNTKILILLIAHKHTCKQTNTHTHGQTHSESLSCCWASPFCSDNCLKMRKRLFKKESKKRKLPESFIICLTHAPCVSTHKNEEVWKAELILSDSLFHLHCHCSFTHTKHLHFLQVMASRGRQNPHKKVGLYLDYLNSALILCLSNVPDEFSNLTCCQTCGSGAKTISPIGQIWPTAAVQQSFITPKSFSCEDRSENIWIMN